jgi:hypothetical protein
MNGLQPRRQVRADHLDRAEREIERRGDEKAEGVDDQRKAGSLAGRSTGDEAQQEQHQKQGQDAHAVEGRGVAEFHKAGIGRRVFHADENTERERDKGHDLRSLRRCAGDQKRRCRDHHDGDQRPGYCTNELGQHAIYLNIEAGSSNFVVFESVRCVSHSVQNCVEASGR